MVQWKMAVYIIWKVTTPLGDTPIFTKPWLSSWWLVHQPSSNKTCASHLGFWTSPMFGVKIFQNIWVFPKMGVPHYGWFIMENPIKTGWFGGVPLFSETSIWTHHHPVNWRKVTSSHEKTYIFPKEEAWPRPLWCHWWRHLHLIADDRGKVGGGWSLGMVGDFEVANFSTTDAWDGAVNHGKKKLPSSSGEFAGLLLAIQQYGFCQRAGCLWGWYL